MLRRRYLVNAETGIGNLSSRLEMLMLVLDGVFCTENAKLLFK